MDNTAWVITQHDIRRAVVIEQLGDYAITDYGLGRAITHLPTGIAITKLDADFDLSLALARLQDVPSFDLQTFRKHRRAIVAACDAARLVG